MSSDPALTQTMDLLRRAQDGSREALDALFARYYERVRRIVRLRLGRGLRSRLDSGDILQETFLDALASFERFEMRAESAFIQWLARIAEHRIRDAADYHGAQKRARGREISLDAPFEGDHGVVDQATSDPTPPEHAARGEQTALVEECLGDLPEEYRELIILRDYVGSSWDEIAEQTGRPSPDAARMKHATAVLELAKLMRQARAAR